VVRRPKEGTALSPLTTTPVETTDAPHSSTISPPADLTKFLANFDQVTQSLISGSAFQFGSGAGAGTTTVSTAKPQTSFSGLLGLAKEGSAMSFKDSMDKYFKDGGTATTINDPVMRYDLASMGKHFKAVDEKSGIFMKDGVFFIKEKLGDHDVLQPVGITETKEGKLKVFGLSSGSLNDDQAKFFERVQKLVENREPNQKPEDALKTIMEKLKGSENPEDALASLEKENDISENSDSSEDSDNAPLELHDGTVGPHKHTTK
jgi:hypothetical protein